MSGPGNQQERDALQAKALNALQPFSLAVIEVQSICLGGRIIIALLIGCDPVHLSAIESDLADVARANKFEVAAELL